MKITTIAKTSLALGLLTTGVITTTTQAANATTPSSTKVEAPQQAANATTPSSTKVETPQQTPNATTPSSTKVEAPQQAANATTPSSTKVEAPKQTPNATTPSSTKVEAPQQAANATTPSSTKVEAPKQTPNATTPSSTKVETPQSPTTKQVPTEINPKFKDLRAYYTKPSLEFKNEIGIILKKWTTIRFMNIVPDYFIYKIALVGKDDKKYGEGVHRNVDVFVVLEENNYNLEKYSVGGITKSNSKKVDHKAGVRITKEDNKGIISHDVSEFKITKEQISLKELDFKLRKQLIENHNLYGNVGSGKIVIKMKNGGKYTFELHKKLQENRMADVIDATNIDNIEVNIK
ncbi:TPA: superantigen-like protein SSL4 [Staphylococcus aureus]|uniref:superantigen-like protein SSL4 n=5 Tax=Staphylococcus aureus TaxID=1280 RepID=UPI0001DA22A7|nr:superantigen-like protein SSL4 [Staphylococcus aureus]ADI96980.1 superantigen-like protein [Staphylococcus aureus subsp. aureus ED133]MBH4764784.1 superantigen-like protein SSL4 [Staphylococcus aureus]MBH4768453.1 superantigen-like protein SSL4 [Staphylococcus aureus]MBH4772564.1 superantigen-like protein SSL4 [Staphylococcus aureus]MBH4776060.1 superantigen-like protein SSL4 [Staphylococcus aureus]